MSRIGKQPISVPAGVKIDISGQRITVTGKKGMLERSIQPEVEVVYENNEILINNRLEGRTANAFRGLTRSLVNNMVVGVEEGFKKEITDFNVGDTVKVFVKVVEGDKERIQPFQGVVIARKGSGARETFMVRKISFGVGVEKIFPVYSPNINKIEVIKQGSVRRAKLYYIREKKGKAAKIKDKEFSA